MDIQYFIVEDKIGNANSTRDKVFIPSKNTFKATIDTKTGHVYLQSQEALNFFKINQSLDKSGKTKYSMFIGEFPQTYVGNRQNEHMEKVLSISSATNKNTSSTLGIINPSGKKYFGHYNTNNNTTINNNTVQKYKTIRKNPYGVRVAKGGISKSEQIKFYVEKGKS